MKKFTNKKGFTLVEMLIVVAIIAVLAAIAIPSGLNALDKAHEATDEADLRTAKTLAAVEAANLAKADNDEDVSFFLKKTGTDAPKLEKVLDATWNANILPTNPEPADTDTGLSKANDLKVVRVDISKYGEITLVQWWGPEE